MDVMNSISIDEIIGGTLFDDLLQKIGGGSSETDSDNESIVGSGVNAPVDVFNYLDYNDESVTDDSPGGDFMDLGDAPGDADDSPGGDFLNLSDADDSPNDGFLNLSDAPGDADDSPNDGFLNLSDAPGDADDIRGGNLLSSVAQQIANKYLNV
jgi:hypothetical protein